MIESICATYLCLAIDGDTIRAVSQRLRIENIDAPERQCQGWLEAKERLQQLLHRPRIIITFHGRDRHGRPLIRLSADGEDFGEILIFEGHAARWPKRAECRVVKQTP
jgi:endonuclease YncB( thermonuclease family)